MTVQNRGPWTPEEDELLIQTVQKVKEQRGGNEYGFWPEIANKIPGRTARQCYGRWNECLDPKIKKGPWTPEENKLLIEKVEKLGAGNWTEIAEEIPGRTYQQCYDRWNECLNPKIKKGPWTPEEDELLTQTVQKIEEQIGKIERGFWPKIANKIPGRTPRQCRDRWNARLNPNLNKKEWTPEEDELLIEKQREFRNKWNVIATYFPGRTDNSVKNRYNRLKKKEREETRNHQGQCVHGIFGEEFNLPNISGGEFNLLPDISGGEFNLLPDISGGEFNLLPDISGEEFNLSDISGEEFNAQNPQEQPTIHQQPQLEQSYADLIATYHDLSSATEYHKRKLYENLGLPFDL